MAQSVKGKRGATLEERPARRDLRQEAKSAEGRAEGLKAKAGGFTVYQKLSKIPSIRER
jgi:hypothetical protein